MMPPTSKTAICLSLRDKSRIKPTEISEPIKAAITSVQEETAPNFPRMTIIVSATTIFAPEEIPNTKGPAIGLEKKVCSKNPESDSAPPKIAAIRMRGRRIFQMMATCCMLVTIFCRAELAAGKISGRNYLLFSRAAVFTSIAAISHSEEPLLYLLCALALMADGCQMEITPAAEPESPAQGE